MTTVAERPMSDMADEPAVADADAPANAPPARPPARRSPARHEPPPVFRAVATTFLLVALLLLGFAAYLYGLSGLSEARSQANTLKSFRYTLSQAVAPVGPVASGTPVAVLNIPSLGITNMVVREGTDARTTTMGPGHRRDTPLPGQAGTVVLMGRRSTFGAPFAHLLRLVPGNQILVTTGQGTATYVVSSFGTAARPAPANSPNRIVLITAGGGFSPTSTVSVSADLKSTVQPSTGSYAPIAADERSMTGAPDRSLLPLAMWGQVLVLLAIAATLGAHRWGRRTTWLCAAPAVLAVIWNVYENAATLLPNVF